MRYLSNETPTQEEFQRWIKWNEKGKQPLPTKENVQRLKEQITFADNYRYSEEDVDKQVKKNRENSSLPVNFTKERLRLMQAMEAERAPGGDIKKADALKMQLNELDEKEYELLKKMENKLSLKNVNKRNAQGDIENVQKAKLQKQKKSSSEIDPYARRQTKVAVSWINIKKPGEEESQASHKEKQGGEVLESAIKKFKTNSGKKINITMDLDLKSITSSKPSTSPVNRGSLLKPTTTLSQNNAAPVKTLSLSDYKKRKS